MAHTPCNSSLAVMSKPQPELLTSQPLTLSRCEQFSEPCEDIRLWLAWIFFLFSPLQKTKVGCTIFWYIQWRLSHKLNSSPSLLYANIYTFILLLSLFFSPTASLPSQPCVYSCCFIMYLIQLSWVSLRMGKNENLLTLYGCDSINTIQGHDFSLCIFLQLKAKLDLKTQTSSGLAMGGKKRQATTKYLTKYAN